MLWNRCGACALGQRAANEEHLGGQVDDPLGLVVEQARGAEGDDLGECRLEVVDRRGACMTATARSDTTPYPCTGFLARRAPQERASARPQLPPFSPKYTTWPRSRIMSVSNRLKQ